MYLQSWVIRVIFFLNRTPLESLEILSCTDHTQSCGNVSKGDIKSMYGPVPLVQFCHVSDPENYSSAYNDHSVIDSDLANDIRDILMKATPDPDSALSKHVKGRRTDTKVLPETIVPSVSIASNYNPVTDISDEAISSKVLTHEVNSPPLNNLKLNHNLKEHEQHFYSNNIEVPLSDSIAICTFTRDQSNNKRWKIEPRKRITGSTCYPLYTYKTPPK